MPLDQKLLSAADRDIINNLLQGGVDRQRGEDLFFNQYAYFIEQAMHKYSFPQDEAFNIYSDTILSAVPKIIDGSFEGRASLKTWLFQIFHNKCVDLIRKNATNKSSVHRTITFPDALVLVADSAKNVLQEMMERTDMELVKQKLSQLGANCQQLLWKWAEGYSDKEIAAELEYKTADVVKTSRLRCLEKLRQLYKK